MKMSDKELNLIKIKLSDKVEEFSKKITPVYKLLNWKWYNSKFPTELQIKSLLLDLINNLQSDESNDIELNFNCQSGGLRVGYKIYELDEIRNIDCYIEMVIDENIYL